VQCDGERLLFPDASFDAVHARQVFHHASSLEDMAKETARVLRSGGVLLAIREHVADDDEQLASFRAAHPLHRLYGGESAYPLAVYLRAFASAGLRLRQAWGPLESILNFYPGTETERQALLDRIARTSWGGAGRWLRCLPQFRAMQARCATRRDRTPGRLYSFLLERP
jgi:SAM-dependent methyltransferase